MKQVDHLETGFMNIYQVSKVGKNAETPVSKHYHSDKHSYSNMRFSGLGSEITLNTQDVHRAKELYYIWEVPTINPIGINQFV